MPKRSLRSPITIVLLHCFTPEWGTQRPVAEALPAVANLLNASVCMGMSVRCLSVYEIIHRVCKWYKRFQKTGLVQWLCGVLAINL